MNTYVIEIEKMKFDENNKPTIDLDFEPDIFEVMLPNFHKAYDFAKDKVITRYDENFVSSGNGLISGYFRLSVYPKLTPKHKLI